MLRRAIAVGLAFLLSAAAVAADDRLDIRILYCGEPASERAKDYSAFLEGHFHQVVVQDLLSFKEEQAKDCDLVIFDWSNTFDGKGDLDHAKMAAMRKITPLSAGFHRPAILIGEAGGWVSRPLNLKIDMLCVCLDGPAHRVAADHALFHTPLEVNPEFAEMATPAGYDDDTVGPTLGPTMKVWHVQTKNYPDVDPGLVSTLYGFADSPDAEVLAQGIAMKGPDTVALGRHANYFLWGFSASPADMTPAARRLFVNVAVYMRQFDGQSPLVRRTSRAREWALRYAIVPRSFTEESRQRSAQQFREAMLRMRSVIPEKDRDHPEAFIAARIKKMQADETAMMQEVIPKPLYDEFGLDAEKYLKYYRENYEFLQLDPEHPLKIVVDDDARTVGPSNRQAEMLERCVSMLERNDRSELAIRLLKRYTSEDFKTATEWRTWLDANRDQLFFSDSGGYKFFVRPKAT